MCDGPVVACTDDDVVVPRDWLANIARAFAADPQLGLLYGQVCVPPSLEGRESPDLIIPSLRWDKSERLHPSDRNFKVWGMGANMAVRRTRVDQIGGFDEAMGGGAPLRSSQDFDFAYRMYRSGHAVLLEPSIKVDHYGVRTGEQWLGTVRNYAIGNGAFYGKHIRCRDPLVLWLLARDVARSGARAARDSLRSRRLIGLGEYERGPHHRHARGRSFRG